MAVATQSKKSGVSIRSCKGTNCLSSFQDSIHGNSVRVFNNTSTGGRCTVCGSELKVSQ